MNDTSQDMERLWRAGIMARSPEERLIMGLSMYDAARKIALSSLEEIKDPVEKEIRLFRRFYAADFSEKQIVPIINWIRQRKIPSGLTKQNVGKTAIQNIPPPSPDYQRQT